MRTRKTTWILLAVVVILAVVTLVRTTMRQEEGEVLVLCGGSMRAVLEEIIDRYKQVSQDTVLATYGGSGELTAQLTQTEKGDIFVCHDPFMPWAAERGRVQTWATVGYLDPVIVVPKGNPKGITGLEDLAQPGLRLGIGDQVHSSSGVVVKHLLEKLDYADAIRQNVRLETKGHQQRCTDVDLGSLDAAIVWNAVAHLFREKLEVIPIPKENIDAITTATYGPSDLKNIKVTIGVTRYAEGNEAASRFYNFATAECRDLFKEYGFRPVEE